MTAAPPDPSTKDSTAGGGGVILKEPRACTDEELVAFEHLVREGFRGSDEGLPDRIRASRWLAFHHAGDGGLAAVAGLKAPPAAYRQEVFAKAGAPTGPAGHELELGWIYVRPALGKGCRIPATT